MTKFETRKPGVVDAYQFLGGMKDGTALARLISQHGANAVWSPKGTTRPESIHITTDFFSERMYIGDWFLINESEPTVTHMSNEDFTAKYKKVKIPQPVLIWKDIPGFPNWQVSDSGKVRDIRFHGYKKRTKDGDFILQRNGEHVRWSEAQIGDEEAIKAFFAE